MKFLKYSFDEQSESLERLAESIHSRYGVVGYSEVPSEGNSFSTSNRVSGLFWVRSHSKNVMRGYIFGVKESYEVLSNFVGDLKMISLNAEPSWSVTLWVTSEDVIRGYVFYDMPLIALSKQQRLDQDE